MKYQDSIEGITYWLDFASICSSLAWKYVGSPFLRFRINGRDIDVAKLEIGDAAGTIYINIVETEEE